VPRISALTRDQLDEFDQRGVVRLPGFYPASDIGVMRDRLWSELEMRHGLYRDRPESWSTAASPQLQALKRAGAFRALGSDRLVALADALLGVGCWDAPAQWGRVLITFPTSAPPLQRPPWHLDITGTERLDPLPILRIFTFLEPVLPRGGGTLYVAGSHRLAMAFERTREAPVRSAPVCTWLKAEHAWFARLLTAPTAELRAFLDVEARVGSCSVRLEEMTGAPGDLIIMHPAILHGTAHNALARPRLMLTEWITRRAGAATPRHTRRRP
jgi:hypothetical protein